MCGSARPVSGARVHGHSSCTRRLRPVRRRLPRRSIELRFCHEGGRAARPAVPATRHRRYSLPMSGDERPGEEHGQDELIAAFAALRGRLTAEELMRLLKAGGYSGALVRLATLLMDGDSAAAGAIVRDSLAALEHAWTSPADTGTARVHLCRAVVNRTR